MAARPLVCVRDVNNKVVAQCKLPAVFTAPIRADLVKFVNTNMAKNKRQPYAVFWKAGHQHSAESWGTGRAVSRIPRISGGGTNRAGQGAFGNMCRKGRMFAPTKIWRRWHRHINVNQKRYATVSALAASAIPALVMARGHKVDDISEIPLVMSNDIEAIQKTAKAAEALEKIHAAADVQKAKDSHKVRAGKGKMRNRRYVGRRGPLVIFNEDKGVTRAFRNLPGVETCHVDRLNLLQLAPGGHLGRLIIWTKGAFEKLDSIYGTVTRFSDAKKEYRLPRPMMTNTDLTRIINSDEVQSALRAQKPNKRAFLRKKNPLRNKGVMAKLNPYVKAIRAAEAQKKTAGTKRKAEEVKERKAFVKRHKPAKAAFFKRIMVEDV